MGSRASAAAQRRAETAARGDAARNEARVRIVRGDAVIAVYVATRHSKNGKPRRGWALYAREGDLICFVDEGYAGYESLRAVGYSGFATGRLAVTGAEYSSMMRIHACFAA